MNLLMLALIKKAVDEQNRSHRRSRRTGKEAPEKKSSSYSSTTYSENEFLTLIISEDPILTAFFKAIEEKGKEIDKQDAEGIRKEVADKLEAQAGRVTKINGIKDELEKLGVVLTNDNLTFRGITVGKKVTETYEGAFGGKGEYAKSYEYFPTVFEGLELKSEWFTDENKEKNPFERDYTYWQESYGDIDEKIKEAEAKISKCKIKVKFAVFGKDYKEYELECAEKELSRLVSAKERGEEIKRKFDTFAKLIPEQREKLKEYFETLEETKNVGVEINEQARNYDNITGHYYSYSYYGDRRRCALERNKWQRAIDALMAEGEVSEELLDAVDSLIAEEDIGYKEYHEGLKDYGYSSHGLSEDCANLINWYLNERKEKIALKALHRKEVAYQRLEAEHKRLAEAAGLVDKAEELEGQDPSKKGDEKNGE